MLARFSSTRSASSDGGKRSMMPYSDLFWWWVTCISWSIAFLVAVSIYLYRSSKTRRMESDRTEGNKPKLGGDFVFVWVLIGLLIMYVVSVNIGSASLFAAGNIVVESILLAYLLKNRHTR
jgi:heme/copper-type cytochrome/quinol oxidase subunit 2